MPQEPQQVDIEELTRLYHLEPLEIWGPMVSQAFPALRDELVRLREATKPISIEGCTHGPWTAEQHPFDGHWCIFQEHHAFQIGETFNYQCSSEMAEANAKLIASAPTLAAENIELRRRLDEAKGLLKTWIAVSQNTELGVHIEEDTRAFLASLAGREEAPRLDEGHLWQSNDRCQYCGVHRLAACAPCTHTPKQEQPTQGEATDDGLVWHKLSETTHDNELTELIATTIINGVGFIVHWTLSLAGYWEVQAMDTERLTWVNVERDEDRGIPLEPPSVFEPCVLQNASQDGCLPPLRNDLGLRRGLWAKQDTTTTQGEVIVHGVNCKKAWHHHGDGWLHNEADDSPFIVDRVAYCGRCHHVMPTPKPEAEGGEDNE